MTNAAALSDTERRKVLALLGDSENELLRMLGGVSDSQWAFRPSPERWSIADTVEHLTIIEPLVAQRIQSTLAGPADQDWENKTVDLAALEAGLLDRSSKIAAPEVLHPKGNLARDRMIAEFRSAREKTIAMASSDLPLKQHFAPHPVLGSLSVYGWLAALALHNKRHNLQIAEVQSAAGYPKA